ncbi:MAG: TonB-dependent receptor [Pseudomonadales bacterium]
MKKLAFLAASCAVVISSAAGAFEAGEEDLLSLYGDEDFVSIATGRKQLLSKAPAVASVITAEQIKKIGAKDIEQVLETVAGLHVSRRDSAYNPTFLIRGIHSDFNAQVLILINGIPVTNVFTGDRSLVWGGMPVQNISRIEVIRGPGSAVYGADAFAGTINIITKAADEIDGLETGFSAGSFDTYHAWTLYGGNVNGWDVAFSMELSETNGHDEKVESDLQSVFDGLLATNASLAPGGVNTGKKSVESRLDISKDEWRLRLGFQGRYDVETGSGVNQALDFLGKGESERFNLDLSYHNPEFSENWDVQGTFSFFQTGFKTEDIHLLPAGAFGGLFPEGLIGSPEVNERHYRYDMSAFFAGFENHNVRLGTGVHYIDQYDIEETKNFTANPPPLPPTPMALTKVSGAALFNREESRTVKYVSIQDEWDFATDWSLTTGLRYDHYSDFGETVNPRLALVWDTSYNLTTKLLYGRAFRAPSFAEQFNQANPVAVGNPDLDPEIINTYELAFDYTHSGDLSAGLNLFYYKMEDIIRFTPVAMNTGDQTGHGLELEFNWQVTPQTSINGNYALQRSKDEANDHDAGHAPEQQVYLSVDHALPYDWQVNTQINHVMDRRRVSADARKDVDDYTTLDLTLMRRNWFGGFDFAVSVYNLTDAEVQEPSLYDSLQGFAPISNDLPQAGRSITAEIRKTW